MAGGYTRSNQGGESSGGNDTQQMADFMGRVAQTMELMAKIVQDARQAPQPNPPPPAEVAPAPREVTLNDFMGQRPPIFKGTKNPIEADEWISDMEKIFDAIGCTDRQKVDWAVYKLTGEADQWWKMVKRTKPQAQLQAMTWEQFKGIFNDKYFPKAKKDQLEAEFLRLEQRDDEDVMAYEERFTRLARHAEHQVNEEDRKVNRFVQGLKPSIRYALVAQDLPTYDIALQKALKVEVEKQRNREDRETRGSGKGKRKAEEKKGNQSKKPQIENEDACSRCGKRHKGECTFNPKECFNCGRKGHFARDFRFAKKALPPPTPTNQQTQDTRPPVTCYTCGEIGHISRNCPKNDKSQSAK